MLDILRCLQEEIDLFVHYVLNYPKDMEYSVCGLDVINAIIRVDKRQHYFRVFHNMEINDCKKAALYAYWIVKFRPIKIIDARFINKTGYNDKVNELFAIHWLICALKGAGKIKLWDGKEGVDLTLENPYLEELCYSLRFRNFTIDSIIVLADAINTESLASAVK
jgi:hypothetical protein